MAKYNVGDKVRIVSEPNWWWNTDGMPKWCGKVMTIRGIDPLIGTCYFMEDDNAENHGFGWLWGDEDIAERIESDTPETKPMPKLTTGMFGVMFDGERFVIVNDYVVYQQSGEIDEVEYITEHPKLVKELYDSPCCFGMIEDGVADVIWENPNTYTEGDFTEDDGDEDVTEGNEEATTEPAKFIEDFIARLEKILGECK